MKRLAILAGGLLCLALAAWPAQAATGSGSQDMKPLAVGQGFPDLTLAGPMPPGAASELGADPGAQSLALHAIKANVVIMVVYTMYCPYCQSEGPVLAALHELIAKRGLRGQVVLIGLAAGNSAYETEVYRQKYSLAFPLFPDQDFAGHKATGQVGTPFFYVLKRQGQGYVVALERFGRMDTPESFLDDVLKATGQSRAGQ